MLEQFNSRLCRIAKQLGKVSPKILVGVSGGVDSISLANLLLQWGADFAIAHCNFSLRQSAAADEQFVTYWAMNRSITLYKTTFDTLGYASSKGISVEMAARELRYDFFLRTAIQEGFDAVAVAHNANDNAETVVLNLVRGSGLKGMGGMAEVSKIPATFAYDGPVRLIRPLLWASREAIEDYAVASGLNFCTDETNADTKYRRNSVRHEVMPLLKALNPSVVSTLSEEASVFSDAERFASSQARTVLSSLVETAGEGEEKIPLEGLFAHEGWQYILYVYMTDRGFSPSAISSLTSLADSFKANPKRITFSGKTFAGGLIQTVSGAVVVREQAAKPSSLPEFEFKVIGRDELDMNLVKEGRIMAVDADVVGDPADIAVRHPLKGDKMRPFGMRSGAKLLSDIFSDAKWPVSRRRSAAVLVRRSDGAVIALWRFRPDDRFKITSKTVRVLTICSR